MPAFFASPAVQVTTGSRGKTTRRRSTRTVRGNDGAYCAMMKQELLAKPAWTMFQITTTIRYNGGHVDVVKCRRHTREDAEAYVAHCQERSAGGLGVREYRIDEVTVKWVWDGRDCVEEVQ